MRTIDISSIIGQDLKSRVAVQDVLGFVKNTGDCDVTLDFSKVQFATRSFVDEFYNTFVKEDCEFPVILSGVPEDIAYMFQVVSSTQNKPKKMESVGNVSYCFTMPELKRCLETF